LTEESQNLRTQLSALKQQHEEENNRFIINELSSAADSIDMALSRFDNPTNLGNPSATAQDVIEDTSKMSSETFRLAELCQNGSSREQFIEGLKGFMACSTQLLDDAKGASRRIDNNDARQKLVDAARRAGESTASFLDLVKQMEGRVQSEDERKMLLESMNNSKSTLVSLSKAAEESERVPEETPGEDLESIAERELLAAAKIIEQAANDLLATKSKPRKPVEPGMPNVAEAILEAAMAITKATG
jgi:hypothetical protein